MKDKTEKPDSPANRERPDDSRVVPAEHGSFPSSTIVQARRGSGLASRLEVESFHWTLRTTLLRLTCTVCTVLLKSEVFLKQNTTHRSRPVLQDPARWKLVWVRNFKSEAVS